jgi:hypothetical protein
MNTITVAVIIPSLNFWIFLTHLWLLFLCDPKLSNFTEREHFFPHKMQFSDFFKKKIYKHEEKGGR